MNYTKSSFISRDGLKLVTHTWLPPQEAHYIVTVIHGMGEHGKRYDSFASYFVQKGFIVTALDLRGHGESEGKRGHTSSFEHLLDDIHDFVLLQEKHHAQRKQILYGYSMGGNFLLNYLLSRDTNVYAAIAAAPALRSTYAPKPVKAFLAKTIRAVYPSFTVKSGVKASDMFKEKKPASTYVKDPLLHTYISMEMALCSIEKAQWALDNACRIDLPLLILHGTSDKVTKHTASSDFISQVDHNFGHLKLYEGLFHDLHNDENKMRVFEDVYEWIFKVTT